MELNGTEPSSSFAILFQLSFPAFICIACHFRQQMQVTLCFTALSLSLFYRVFSVSNKRPPVGCAFTGLFECHFGKGSKAHLPPFPMHSDKKKPLSTHYILLVKPKPTTVTIATLRRCLHLCR